MTRNLESTRQGRQYQVVGAAFIALGAGLTVLNALIGDIVSVCLGIFTVVGGYFTLDAGGRMVRNALMHKIWMDKHRALSAARQNARWN